MKQIETVYQYIEHAILENRIPPGTRLRELQLADIFGVKRGLIRKVLARLTTAKLVDHIPHVGAQVACPSLKDGQDLFATRRILELGVVRQLCGHLQASQVHALRQHIKQELQAYQSGDAQTGVRLSAGFHQKLAELTDNQVLQEFLQEILNRTPLVMMTLAEEHPSKGCINHDHSELIDALSTGDCANAVDIMGRHLQQLEDMFKQKSDRRETDLAEIFQKP